MNKKINLAMAKLSNQLSLIANNLVAGKYKSSKELQAVSASLANAEKTCKSAYAATAGKINSKQALILASKTATSMDDTVDAILSAQAKTRILAQVLKAEMGEMEDMESVINVDDNIVPEDFGAGEPDGDELVTESDAGQLSGDDLQNPPTDLDDGLPKGDDSVQEVLGEDAITDDTILEDELGDEGTDLDDLTAELEDPELEEFMDETPAPVDTQSKRAEARKMVTTPAKTTQASALSNLFNFKGE